MVLRQIGEIFNRYDISDVKYFSSDYLLEADILIIDLNAVDLEINNFFRAVDGENLFEIKNDDLKKFQSEIKDRNKEIQNYLLKGGNLFIFFPDTIYDSIPVKITPGGILKNIKFNLLNTIGVNYKDFSIIKQSGKVINFEKRFQVFFNNFNCSYSFCFEKYPGTALGKVVHSERVVSLLIPSHNGNIIILPPISIKPGFFPKQAFIEFDKILKHENDVNGDDEQPPAWVKNYTFGDEQAEIECLNDLYDEKTSLQDKINQQKKKLNHFDELKLILFSSGRKLELVIERIFKELGYNSEQVAQNRDDLILSYNGAIAVVEIKGVKGSAAEKYAAQLMKWVNNYHVENGVNPKGILIVNTYKDKPLKDRVEDSFPNQMLPYCKQQKFCLLTTVQLLEIYLDFKNNVITIDRLHKLLFATVGIIKYDSVNKILPSKVTKRQEP